MTLTLNTRRSAALAAAVLVGGLLPLVVLPAAPAEATAEKILPAVEYYGERRVDVFEGDAKVPTCGSKNIDGSKAGVATWTVTSSIGPGSVVRPGTTWTLTAEIVASTGGSGDNGPDPMKMSLKPLGPVGPGAAPKGVLQKYTKNVGNDPQSAVGPFGDFGYEFDVNSHPGVTTLTDAVKSAKITVVYKALAPGKILLGGLAVEGYDGSPSDEGDFDCIMSTDSGGKTPEGFPDYWSWTVAEPAVPTSANDLAFTDASYELGNVDDKNGGEHGVLINVLANDNDPDTPGNGGTDEVRIKDWQPASAKGGTVACGLQAQKGETDFSKMSVLPCSYRPKQGFAGSDSFGYVLAAVGGSTHYTTVTVKVIANRPPFASDTEYSAQANTEATFDLAPLDPDFDKVVCNAEQLNPDGNSLFVNADCTATWKPKPGFSGSTDFAFVACDQHVLLAPQSHGSLASAAQPYTDGSPDDQSSSMSRRCATLLGKVSVSVGGILPPVGKADVAEVDAGYPGDGVGDYGVILPVLANDTDGNGPEPSEALSGVVVQIANASAGGTATVLPDRTIRFTPKPGFDGLASFTYRLCEAPLLQMPPYLDNPVTPVNEGLPFCGIGKVGVNVRGNAAPAPVDDSRITLVNTALTDVPVTENDIEPDGELLECEPGLLVNKSPALIGSASIDADCLVDVEPVSGKTGVGTVDYRVCDDHGLLKPTGAADPYGTDGRTPGSRAPRCATASLKVTVLAPLVAKPVDNDPLPLCVADTASTGVRTPVTIKVLTNDSDLDTAQKPSPLDVASAFSGDEDDVTAQGGTAIPSVDGTTVRYLPKKGFTGKDTFSYAALDTAGHSCTAQVTVAVDPSLGTGEGVSDDEIEELEGSGGGGDLPTTGAAVATQLLAAGLIAGAGTFLLRTARRRREAA